MKLAVCALMMLVGLPALAPMASAQVAPTTGPASAEVVRGGMFDASDPAALRRFLEERGYQASLVKDDVGDPVIKGRLSRTDYLVQFYECEGGAFCNSVQFIATAAPPPTIGLQQVNDFNAQWRYARATIVGGTLRLQLDLNLDAGVTASNLEDTLDIWRQLIEFFERDLLGAPSA